MLKLFAIILLLLAVCNGKVSYKGYQVIRASPLASHEREFLKRLGEKYEIRFWRGPERPFGPVDMLVSEEKVPLINEFLKLNRITHDVIIDDVQEAIIRQVSLRTRELTLAEFDYNKYHDFEEIDQWITNFAAVDLGRRVTKMHVGMTYENRTFHALKISSGTSTMKKPAFAIDCGIHADEWIGPATCIHVIKNLTENVGRSTEAGRILNDVDFYIIPSSNPDGYVYSWTTDRMWRKTRSPTEKGCFGVDPNRNWDSNFGGKGSSNDPCSDDYHGPHAWSEANVRGQRDFVNGLENLQAYIDVHSYSQLWMFPYGYTFDKPRDFDLLSKIANESVAAIKQVHGKTYTPGQIASTIYIASGSTADYFYDHDEKLKCVFAAELRDTGKHGMLLPESEIQPTAEEVFAGLMVIARNIMDGNCAP